MNHAVEAKGLRKTYRDGLIRRRVIDAVNGLSFEVHTGEIYGLLGPNGAGKTTTIKMLLGIVHLSAGDATLLGKPVGHRATRRDIGYLPEHLRIPRHHTGASALAYYGRLSGLSDSQIRKRAPGLLDRVGLASWGKTRITKYSKGMLQRLGLAQAMLHDPQLLILDEPTDGVDPVGRSDIRAILKQLKSEGKTIVLNSHLLQEVELVCDRVAILQKGQVLHEGNVADLTQRDGREMEFAVLAPEAIVTAALPNHAIKFTGRQPSGELTFTLHAPDQPALDGCVDALRAKGVSIVSVTKRRQSLEDAFLQLVGPQGDVR